ncbi:unnamed protein product [Lepeophtheirus salmonis]|uniref:(salmon louse) hypothetical protein n=1 Tax=Lepeophtheirus salmonis TaxID=72036 RepID=A0A7R8CKC6_LEPSM|nr:unnamed protein product [Lepeophtheirus salmonis]CAF2844403.1 unnamed protein product [Lepeophtheirus salmonis]
MCLILKVYLDSPKSEQEILYHGGNSSYWGRSNTSTILKYSTDFFPFPKDKKHRIEQYTNDFEVKQSVAGFKITFRRKPEVYIFDYYIPSGIFVVVSWVSLVIPPDAPPGRIALIITTFLVLVNIANSVFSKSPRAHSINPIQVWILSCIVFVFITVLEYAVVLFIIRRQRKYVLDLKKKKQKTKRNNSKVSHSELSIMEEKPKISAVTNEVALGVLTTNIDHASYYFEKRTQTDISEPTQDIERKATLREDLEPVIKGTTLEEQKAIPYSLKEFKDTTCTHILEKQNIEETSQEVSIDKAHELTGKELKTKDLFGSNRSVKELSKLENIKDEQETDIMVIQEEDLLYTIDDNKKYV